MFTDLMCISLVLIVGWQIGKRRRQNLVIEFSLFLVLFQWRSPAIAMCNLINKFTRGSQYLIYTCLHWVFQADWILIVKRALRNKACWTNLRMRLKRTLFCRGYDFISFVLIWIKFKYKFNILIYLYIIIKIITIVDNIFS